MTDSKPSKSARKREHLAAQALGEQLIDLSEQDLATLDLDANLRDAIRAAATMRSRGALRRQKQLIGKLMRDADVTAIREGLAELTAVQVRGKRVFAAAERWRDRLLSEPAALGEFAAQTDASTERLAGLLNDLEGLLDERREKTLKRELFREIHAILASRS